MTIQAIHQRAELRNKFIELHEATCNDCKNNKKWERIWLKILEQVLYKKRDNDK